MNVQQLLESSNQYKVVMEDAKRLSAKWEKSGLLEGIKNTTDKNTMSMLLENQAKQLITEASVTGGTNSMQGGGYNSENWAGVALPLVRRVFGEIAAKELFESIQSSNLGASKKTSIKESIGFASKAAGVAPKSTIVESNDVIARMQKLANIIK